MLANICYHVTLSNDKSDTGQQTQNNKFRDVRFQ